MHREEGIKDNWCLVSFGAWIRLVPGYSWCLDRTSACIQFVPGCNWCLDKIGPERCSGVAVS